MPLEKFEYPASGPVTNSWLPTRNPSFTDAQDERDKGTLAEESAGRKLYTYETGLGVTLHRRLYRNMPDSEKISFESFFDVVGGRDLKFTDYVGAVKTVKFEPEKLAFSPRRGNRWDFGFTLREEV